MDSQDYQSLKDRNLNEYFNNKRIRRHLIKAGLINRHGDILPPTSREVTFARRAKRRQTEPKLSHPITNYAIEEERKRQKFLYNHFDLAIKRSRVQKIRESRHQKQRSMSHSLVNISKYPRSRNARTPSPTIEKRSPIRVKSARYPPINVRNQVIRRPTTAKQQLNDDYCEVTMIYYGPPTNIDCKNNWSKPNGDEIILMQQHCGGENLIVFKGFVKSNETFTFESRRHRDYPFALALYINGLIDSRISVCCEYKHKYNVRLGSKYGLFGIYDVQKSQPCRFCRFEQRKKKILSTVSVDINPSPNRRLVLTSDFRLGDLLRTPITSPEREKKGINRISTVVQTSPRTSSSESSPQKKDNTSSDILFKTEQPHHSSEPILTKRDTDDDQSSDISRKSGPSSIPFSTDEDNHHSLKLLPDNTNNNNYPTRSSTSTSSKKSNSSLSIALVKNNDNHIQSSRSSSSATLKRLDSSSSSSISEDDHPVSKLLIEDADTEKQLSRSSTSDASLIIKERTASTSSSSTDKKSRSSISSVNNQQSNDIITQNPVKSNATSSDDDDTLSKQKRRNESEEPLSTEPEKTPGRQYRAVENIILVWLDATIADTNTDTINIKQQLRQITRTLRTFTDPNKCIQLFKEIKDEKIFLIVSGSLSENILQQINNDYSQLVVIYIYCQDKHKYEHLIDQYKNLKGIYTDIKIICNYLKIDSKQWDNDLNTFEISSIINIDLLFIQNQLFKEYLLNIKYDNNSINDLIDYCQKLYIENDNELELIKQFKDNYQTNNSIDWYTKDCFIYHMINKAIRMKDIKILYQMGFLIQDINHQLEEDYSSTVHRSTLTVYRGQGIKMEYFEELKQNQGGILSFNGFVSTSKKRNVGYEYAQRSLLNGFSIAILFQIKIDPKTTSIPFISLENLSSNPSEYEVLLSFKSIFSIELIEQIENNLWQIDLTLTDKISPYIKIENEKFNHLIDYEKLGELLIEMNELNKAKDLYEINLPNNNTDLKYTYIYNQLGLIYTKLEIYNQAILYYNLSLKTKSNDYVKISNIHKEIGKIFYKQNKIRDALEKFQYALDIQLEHLSSTDLPLISTYEFLGMIFEENEDYETALEYYQKQFNIQQESSLLKQSDLALNHFKIAICLENLNRFDEAMEHIQQSIDISPSDDLELNDRQAVRERIREQLE